MNISPIISFSGLKNINKSDNSKNYAVSTPIKTDSFSFKGGDYNWSEPIYNGVGVYTKDPNEAFRATKRKNLSIHTNTDTASTMGRYFEGGIEGCTFAIQNNKEAVIGRHGKNGLSLNARGEHAITNAKRYLGGIRAQKNVIQFNDKAVIGVDKMGRSINADYGSLIVNAADIAGDVKAWYDAFIVGKGNIEGEITAYSGTVYLVNAKDPSEYRFAPNSKIEVIKDDNFDLIEYIPKLGDYSQGFEEFVRPLI